MSKYFMDRSSDVNGYLNSAMNAINNLMIRMKYYQETNDSKFLDDSNDWLEVANIYMREINTKNYNNVIGS